MTDDPPPSTTASDQTPMTTDPLTFLTAAWDSAQREGEAAGGDAWTDHAEGWRLSVRDAQERPVATLPTRLPDGDDFGTATHIARHNPAAVLRRIAKERELVAGLAAADPHAGYITSTFTTEDALRLLAEGWGWTEETT